MRVLNEPALKADVDNMFDISMAHENKKIQDWFKGAWLKHIVKIEWFQKQFLHKMNVLGNDSMFQGLKPKTVKSLQIRVGGRKVEIKDFTEYDVKDAQNGLLYWYQPTTHSLLHFNYMKEVTFIRDYFKALIEHNPQIDLRRMNAADATRAATQWHADAEKRRQEQLRLEELRRQQELERLSAEQRKRMEEDAVKALRDFRGMGEGKDWEMVSDELKDSAGSRYTMIRLLSPRSLDVEAEHMAHCTYNYKSDLFDGHTVLLSVRLAAALHHPLVTVELQMPAKRLVQVKPFHNGMTWKSNDGSVTLPPATVPHGLDDSIERVVRDPKNEPKLQALNNPNEFRVQK